MPQEAKYQLINNIKSTENEPFKSCFHKSSLILSRIKTNYMLFVFKLKKKKRRRKEEEQEQQRGGFRCFLISSCWRCSF